MSTIRGTEGLTPSDIQNEIARGARFVAYQWCVSLLVVTLKRGTRLYYLRPGETGFVPGFLWSAFTLVAGWRGIPWGPIYTIGSLWTNLRGGIDVTAAVARALCLHDHAAAHRSLSATEAKADDGVGQLLLYLSASVDKNAEAERYWQLLLATWNRTGGRHARLVAHFDGTAPLTDAELLDYPLPPAEKRLVLAAIGLHEPQLRAAAFARAKLCNFSREFPYHLVAAALATHL